MGYVTSTFRVVDDQATPAPIDGVLVQIFDSNDVYVTEGVTGAVTPGEVDFLLLGNTPAVDYIVRLSKDGFSFLPGPTSVASITDPPPPLNEFQFTGREGPTTQLVTFITKSNDPTPVLLEGSTIRVHDEADSFITELTTDASGFAELPLEGDPDPGRTYIVRVKNPGWTFELGPTSLVNVLDPIPVGSLLTNEFTFLAEQPSIPESSDSDMCLLSGTFTDVSLRPLRDVTLRFIPTMVEPDGDIGGFPGASNPSLVRRMQLIRESEVTTGPDGYVEALLPRGGTFEVHLYGVETPGPKTVGTIMVPDAAGAKLEDVLFPYVSSVTYDPTTVSFVTGDTVEVTIVVEGSNGRDLSECSGTFLEFASSDEDVFTVTQSANVLTLTAVGVGTGTVEVSRKPDTNAPRAPSTPDLVVTPLPVEVAA